MQDTDSMCALGSVFGVRYPAFGVNPVLGPGSQVPGT